MHDPFTEGVVHTKPKWLRHRQHPPSAPRPVWAKGPPNPAQTPECVCTQGVQVKEGGRSWVVVVTTVASTDITFTKPRGHQSRVGAINAPSDFDWYAS